MKRKLLYVEWLDHTSNSSDGRWVSKEDLDKSGPELCHSVGWLHKQDKVSITLVSSYGDDEDTGGGGDITIIKSCIVTRKVLDL